MTRKELEMKLLDMTEEMYKMAKEVDPEIDWLSIAQHGDYISVSAYKDDQEHLTVSDIPGTYRAYAVQCNGNRGGTEYWAKIYGGMKEEIA